MKHINVSKSLHFTLKRKTACGKFYRLNDSLHSRNDQVTITESYTRNGVDGTSESRGGSEGVKQAKKGGNRT